MESRFEITEEMMRKAQTYTPIALKEQVARIAAPGCVKRLYDFDFDRLAYLEEKDDLPTTMPMYGEDTSYKSRVVMGMVLHFYLGIEVGDDLAIRNDVYDKYAESHVINQIERYKTNAEFKSKAFDMLADIRDFERRLNCAVYNLLQVKNDLGGRVMKVLGVMMSQEALESVIRSANEAQEGIKAEKEKQDRFIDGLEAQEATADG
jgi:hypothetical protein